MRDLIEYYPAFIDSSEADRILFDLIHEVSWESRKIKLFGKVYDQPRLIAWQGEFGYSYSGDNLLPKKYTPTVSKMLEQVNSYLNTSFNGVLLNQYRNGNDSMGWHADDESELGIDPIVASLSFGDSRMFKVRGRQNHKNNFKLALNSGDLLLMKSGFQNRYQHGIPKTKNNVGMRINLTFRQIF